MFVHEQNIVLEARIEMRLQSQVHDHRVVMTIDVRVYAIQALEDIADGLWEVLGKGHTNAAWEGGFVVNIGLYPRHEVLDILGRRHLGGLGKAGCGILPEIFESSAR